MPRLLCALALLAAAPAAAGDWPSWRGPARDGRSPETAWSHAWPEAGPRVAWTASVGTGFSSVAVAGGRAYTLGHDGTRDVVHAFDAATGKALWTHAYDSDRGPKMFEGGPTSTPCVHEGRVYTLGRWGDALCFDAADGTVVWSVDVHASAGRKIPTWGFAGSPVAWEDLLLLNVGEAGMALDRATGRLVWASPDGDAGYSTPLPFAIDGVPCALFSNGDAHVAVKARSGEEVWRIDWITRYGVNAADPVLVGDGLFLSSGYAKGGGFFRLGKGAPAEVWRNKALRTQMNPAVALDGLLYGVDGDTSGRAVLKCLDAKTGETRWVHEGIGSGSVTAAGDRLIVLTDKGELIVAPASPEGFAPAARAQVLQGKCWTVPVLSDGRLFVRNAAGDLACLDLRKDP